VLKLDVFFGTAIKLRSNFMQSDLWRTDTTHVTCSTFLFYLKDVCALDARDSFNLFVDLT
jgi:hypothetical protein